MKKLRSKQTIYFITGVSGAGKSTLVPLLKKKLERNNFDIHDFDEQGVPVKADKNWRKIKEKYWLEIGYKNAKNNLSTIISGIIWPNEVMEILDKRRAVNIKFCLLNHTNLQRKQRLEHRLKSKTKVKELQKIFNISPMEFIANNLNLNSK